MEIRERQTMRLPADAGELGTYRVRRPGRPGHLVAVEFDAGGAVQAVACDCEGYRWRLRCAHVDAWAAGRST